MLYLKSFELPDRDTEENVLMFDRRTYINEIYSYNIFPNKELKVTRVRKYASILWIF